MVSGSFVEVLLALAPSPRAAPRALLALPSPRQVWLKNAAWHCLIWLIGMTAN